MPSTRQRDAGQSTYAGYVVSSLAFDIADEQIVAIYAIRNPDKLRHLS
jgi:hypothetical protein